MIAQLLGYRIEISRDQYLTTIYIYFVYCHYLLLFEIQKDTHSFRPMQRKTQTTLCSV